jgi:hypothetical protein
MCCRCNGTCLGCTRPRPPPQASGRSRSPWAARASSSAQSSRQTTMPTGRRAKVSRGSRMRARERGSNILPHCFVCVLASVLYISSWQGFHIPWTQWIRLCWVFHTVLSLQGEQKPYDKATHWQKVIVSSERVVDDKLIRGSECTIAINYFVGKCGARHANSSWITILGIHIDQGWLGWLGYLRSWL